MRRSQLLQALRREIETCGLRLTETRGGWGYRVLAEGPEALRQVEHDESEADANHHWWSNDAVWRSDDGETVLVYGADPDGNDIEFVGWGPNAQTYLRAVNERLAEHHP
jgi:hypothetical protein